MEEFKASSDFMHFGQLISICLEEDNFITSKGFIDNSVYLQQFDDKGTFDFSGSIFIISLIIERHMGHWLVELLRFFEHPKQSEKWRHGIRIQLIR